MTPARDHYGLALYSPLDLRKEPRLVTGAFQDLETVWPDKSVKWQGELAGSDRFTRLQRVSQTTLDQVVVGIKDGAYSSLLAFVGGRSGDRVTLTVELQDPEETAYGSIEYIQSLPDDDSLALATAAARVLWRRFSPAHGFGVVRASWTKVASELTGFIVNPPGGEVHGKEQDRLFVLQQLRHRFGEVARVPAWDTFLGGALVNRLGGADRIRHEAPVAVVADLPGGGLHLRLTETPEPWGSRDWLQQNRSLAKFLAPVLPEELVGFPGDD